MMGPSSPAQAQSQAPRSIRAVCGTDDIRNAVHGSSSAQKSGEEIEFFFGEQRAWPTTALFNNCTLCVVRPHAFVSSAGEIVHRLLAEGFEISAMGLWYLDKASSEEFLAVYKGVIPEYHDVVTEMCGGPCLVMEIRQEDAVNALRQLAGPLDPEVAKHLRPKTLRAQYGLDRVKNAVHCTDLQEDGLLEVEYFFNILHSRK
jgi:nucleoside-diphosphate kinase